MKHNELVNIWTHLIGAILVLGFIFYLLSSFNISFSFKQKFNKDMNNFFRPIYSNMMELE